ncbi:hypothetical protein L2E82_03064 [Cichorium intybus]|uniref:Uncharacterized protein n=1 Tax=Cichorium intybus TaxID=13427 RepID=A0ACB9H390_CICIN|nr:hypothetical protein L2E82_03064 [Cichorium intybus]
MRNHEIKHRKVEAAAAGSTLLTAVVAGGGRKREEADGWTAGDDISRQGYTSEVEEKQLVLYAQMASHVNIILQWPNLNIKEIAKNFSKNPHTDLVLRLLRHLKELTTNLMENRLLFRCRLPLFMAVVVDVVEGGNHG